MAVVTIGGFDVLEGMVKFGIRGTWLAQLQIESSDTLPFDLPCTLDIGGDQFVGTIIESAADKGNRVTVTAIGGAAGLDDPVFPLHYFQSTVGTLLADALAIGSERLAVDADGDVLSLPIEHFTRTAGTVRETIRAILRVAEAAGGLGTERLCWRVDFTGMVWVGRQIFLPFDIEADVVEERPDQRSFVLELEHASALPGRIIQLHDLTDVVYHITPRSLRAVCTYAEDEERNQADQHWDALVRARTAQLELALPIGYDVVVDNGDGTLDLLSSDETKWPSMAHVAMRSGSPGNTEQKVQPGTRVLVMHENGDPSKPFVLGYALQQAQGFKMVHTSPVEIVAPEIKMGGSFSMPTMTEVGIWLGQLAANGAGIGLTVPPWPGNGTQILKGG